MSSSPRDTPSSRRASPDAVSRRSVVAGALGVVPLLSGCAFDSTALGKVTDTAATRTAVPNGSAVVAADSITVSAALFQQAPLAIVVENVPESLRRAAHVSIAWGVPLFVGSLRSTPKPAASDATSDSVTADLGRECARLGVQRVLAIGDVTAPSGVDVVASSSDIASLAAVTGMNVTDLSSSELASFSPGATQPLSFGALPTPPTPLTGVLAVARASDADVPAVATARAAGVPVTVITGDDLLASASALTAITGARPDCTLLLGPALAAQARPEWAVRAAASGWQLPGGGQRFFEGHFFVAIYGTPGAPVLGVLGEQGVAETITRAKAVADPYRTLTDKTVVPSLEIITTVAAGEPGSDGNYSNERDADDLRPYLDAAAKAGMYVVLDLQPGRTDFLTQAREYEALLRLPHVGLALDPEWRLAPDQLPLKQIGQVSAEEVNSVSSWLADLVQREGLPPKMFVLHQFRLLMLQDRSSIRRDRPELEFLIHVDGQGSQPDKRSTWDALHTDAPEGIAWGWKNFYDEDSPMLTPAETMAQVRPLPNLITYQ
ncbi:hypothetical protein [Rathayibacter toxicus]|uniref:hypothetical protein n=1 Tax=Rathayibacter toxicus TaxID=145458 RepID=UPI000CE832BD|nr:hypothetical protein [Rathayibacter toxicus]PPI56619.1 hypothetical protein C5D35_01080 [Rathayibacter toxicus]QOD10352.1 hypothetical protein BSG36_10715 [Rathayibacter toxicus]QWL29025.1 hypothetical protein E2R33_10725 [Rathayibacter toxicus]